jgi:hypothetical protein
MVNALLDALVDDAALFPPGNAPMPKAVADHRAYRDGPHASLLGRFLCRGTRIRELSDHLAPDDAIRLGLIADAGITGLPDALAAIAAEPRLHLEVIEIPLPADVDQVAAARQTLAALPAEPGLTCYVELPRVPGWRDALDEVAAAGRGAKLRTGGLVAAAFPTEREVADFILACVQHGLTFKATAGLHNAVRHQDPVTGFEHHGFLNILLATAAASGGRGDGAVLELLAERDGERLAAEARRISPEQAAAARAHFAGYGSCSFGEPVEDLSKLGLLPS